LIPVYRAKIFLQCERPALALMDMKEVFAEAPDDFRAHCTYVSKDNLNTAALKGLLNWMFWLLKWPN
jgi:hypothetical protein